MMKRTLLLFFLVIWVSCKSNKMATNPTNKLPLVYSKEYNISFYGIQHLHPFDTGKYGKVVSHLNKTLQINKEQYHVPTPISDAELLKVHSQSYLEALKKSETIAGVAEMGILTKLPVSVLNKKLLRPIKLATAGTLKAGELAMTEGWAINLSGGYHHAKKEQGEGFCFFADVNLLIEHLRAQKLIKSALIVDLDAHQGNGHESIHGKDTLVHIFDMYNAGIYPGEHHLKQFIDFDIPLNHKTKDAEYLSLLAEKLPEAIKIFQPDILIYVAGTDIYEHDPLGNLSITQQGIIERDKMVFSNALKNNIPIVMTLSGGYHKDSGSIIGKSIENLLKTVLKG